MLKPGAGVVATVVVARRDRRSTPLALNSVLIPCPAQAKRCAVSARAVPGRRYPPPLTCGESRHSKRCWSPQDAQKERQLMLSRQPGRSIAACTRSFSSLKASSRSPYPGSVARNSRLWPGWVCRGPAALRRSGAPERLVFASQMRRQGPTRGGQVGCARAAICA